MNSLRRWQRLLHIQLVLLRHGLDDLVLATHLLSGFRFLYHLAPWNWRPRRLPPQAQRIREALEELGPIFVKFGQMLSTRRDLLPQELGRELAKLQDRVPPFPGALARARIEASLGHPVGELFADFDEQALASASIAQVHAATLHDGREVVVKVLRPGVLAQIERDLEVLRLLAGLAQRFWADGRRLRPVEVVAEFDKTLHDELDMQREAANAQLLRRNFAGTDLLYVPEIHWPLTRRDVLVMERIRATPISDLAALRAAGTDFKALSERGVEIFFTQVFRDNFFHADMHPGNIFVSVADPARPRYMAVDFGIMGSLSATDQRYLAENFIAFFHRDYRRVARLHVESGWAPPGTREDEFEAAIRTVCEPIFEKPLSEISFGKLLLRLFQTARRFNMEVQPQLVLLQKTLLNIEGLGRDLYPGLDLWQTAKPYLERWMSEQVGVRGLFKRIRQDLPAWGERLPELPLLVHKLLDQAARGELMVTGRDPEMARLREALRQQKRRHAPGLTGAVTVICAALLWGLDKTPGWTAAALAALGLMLLWNAYYAGSE
jgi:ubiquinone biosynthesis protein